MRTGYPVSPVQPARLSPGLPSLGLSLRKWAGRGPVGRGGVRRRRSLTGSRRWRLAAAAAAILGAATACLPLAAAASQQPGAPASHRQTGQQVTSRAAGQHASSRAGAAPAARPTVVSLTFDDGDADQMTAARILHGRGLRGTFYIITGAIGAPGYMTRADLRRLAAAGNEIGGHTVSHLDLTRVPLAEARRQLCGSRAILAGWGYRASSFAYPGGFYSPALAALTGDCGYRSARITDGLLNAGCPGCTVTEGQPPAQPYAIRTPGQVDGAWTLAMLEQLVTRAQRHGGGWLPLVFHHICATAACPPLGVRASLLAQFAAWLASQRQAGVEVRTVGSVIGGAPRPLAAFPPASAHDVVDGSMETQVMSAAVDPSLEKLAGQPGRFVQCWMPAAYGRSTVRWAPTRDARSGRWALRMTITGYASGDAKVVQQFDLGACSLPVQGGRSYLLSSWYQATARTQYSVYWRDAAGRWRYWTSSPFFRPSRGWARAAWQTPALPAGATGLSFGLAMAANGTLTSDSYHFSAAPPDIPAILARWIVAAEALAGTAALGWAAARLARRRRGRRPAAAASSEVAGSSAAAGNARRAAGPPASSSSR
jgi:peptidoglycan/xylan/chitin deacetylase (PgdA/CDA1 family)